MSEPEPERRALPGSLRNPEPGADLGTPVDPQTPIEVTVHLRRGAGDGVAADPADVESVLRVLGQHGVTDVTAEPATRRVFARGRAAELCRLFGTTLHEATARDPVSGAPVRHRHRSGELSVPVDLDGVVVAVLGLDDRPQARPHLRRSAAPSGYLPAALGDAYDFPTGTDGSGQVIAVIELGGGYRDADLAAFFSGIGLAVPAVRPVGVDGAANAPTGTASGPDAEVALDLEVAGGLAPNATLAVYFAPNTDRGFVDAVAAAAHASPAPTAMSISWGGPENSWTGQARAALDSALADAATLGVTVCAAAGDSGSSDGESDGRPHVDFPASSPHALGCGGTRLVTDPATGARRAETVWNDGPGGGATGGGLSAVFPVPGWQAGAGVPPGGTPSGGRGVPDVAGDADPVTGYQIVVDGTSQVIGGTSAVAPLWAALVARLAQAAGRPLGLLAPLLYPGAALGRTAAGFTDITSGDNGDFAAGPGWDACTGLGTPVGSQLLARLTGGG